MSTEHSFDSQNKINSKSSQNQQAEIQKAPLTVSQIQTKLDAGTVTQMQQTIGNTAVQRYLAGQAPSVQRKGSGPQEIDEGTTSAIENARGSGQGLDKGMAEKAGNAMGQDFSNVKIHTDGKADQLSRDLGAVAFTTKNDIFFRSGAYNPGSSEGQHLIAHELTHTVQQGATAGAAQTKTDDVQRMTVNDPNDKYEAEADSVADMVMNQPEDKVQRETAPQEEEQVQKQEDEEQVSMQEDEEQVSMQEDEEQVSMQEDEEQVSMQEDEEQVSMQEDEEQVSMQEDEEQVSMQEDEEQVQKQEESKEEECVDCG